jgi:capsular polysaccharide biosynthesis protein
VVNEDALVPALGRLGFSVVRAEELTFGEQVARFAEAEVVVGAHGAGLTNVVFSPEATLIELFEASYTNPCYEALSAACGHRYQAVVSPRRGDGHIRASVDAVERAVHAALA